MLVLGRVIHLSNLPQAAKSGSTHRWHGSTSVLFDPFVPFWEDRILPFSRLVITMVIMSPQFVSRRKQSRTSSPVPWSCCPLEQGLDLGFTSVQSLDFPANAPKLLELSLRLCGCAAFHDAKGLLILEQQKCDMFLWRLKIWPLCPWKERLWRKRRKTIFRRRCRFVRGRSGC